MVQSATSRGTPIECVGMPQDPVSRRAAVRSHWAAISALASLLFAVTPQPAIAIDAIVLEVGEVEHGAIKALDAVARLDLPSDTHPQVAISVATLVLPEPIGRLRTVKLRCRRPIIAEPRFACRDGRIAARGGPTGAFAARVQGEFRSDTGAAFLRGAGLKIASATLDWRAHLRAGNWSIEGNARGAHLIALRQFASRWYALPSNLTVDGALSASFTARGGAALQHAEVTTRLGDINFTNDEGTLVGEALAGELTARYQPGATGAAVHLRLTGSGGQTLIGPVLLNLQTNPLDLRVDGILADKVLRISQLDLSQRDLLTAHGTGSVALSGDVPLTTAHLTIEQLQFPAAYTSFLQIGLAATDFGDLTTSGTLSGSATIVDNAPQALSLKLTDVDLIDRRDRVRMNDLLGTIEWRDSALGEVPESALSWASGGAYGLSGGAAQIQFRAFANNISLTRPARLPVFDGAVAIDSFALGNIGSDKLAIDFEAEIEPISMPLICAAFGWPRFAGTLSGRIPALTFRDNELRVTGDVEAAVFDGQVVASNLRLQDPFGRWPRLFADVRARDLDLAAVTNTFAFGSITGKLEADVLRLELFAWSPVAFDARLETPSGDRSNKRISAKAVGNLSNIGGGGGGVVAALQSGFLRFFDDFGYRKLGIKCQLRDAVCLMSGIEPARSGGYYIVKGRGIPRIDIIGNAGRVDWPRLVSQISAGMAAENVEVR